MIKDKKAVIEDFSIWMLIGLLVLVVGAVIAYLALKNGMINLDFIKNAFR